MLTYTVALIGLTIPLLEIVEGTRINLIFILINAQ